MHAYRNLLISTLAGEPTVNRTGVKTRSLWGAQLVVNLAAGFPALTTKELFFRGVVAELCWFLRGDTNVRALQAQAVHIWDAWADKDTGELGPIYGEKWMRWGVYREGGKHGYGPEEINQIENTFNLLKREPDTRRAVITAWDPADVDECRLPPCHFAFQFRRANGRLHCTVSMRSCDIFLGLPFNVASYALLTELFAQRLGDKPGTLAINFGDLHLYESHLEAAREQIKREPRPLPSLVMSPFACGEEHAFELLTVSDFALHGYDPHPRIKAPIAV